MTTEEIKECLVGLGLDSNNSIVIGSGILCALGIRESKDVDVVVLRGKWEELRGRKTLSHVVMDDGRDLLMSDTVEIGYRWAVLGKNWEFNDLWERSTVVEGLRYSSLELLLEVKRSWASVEKPRLKDINDVRLIEEYLAKVKS